MDFTSQLSNLKRKVSAVTEPKEAYEDEKIRPRYHYHSQLPLPNRSLSSSTALSDEERLLQSHIQTLKGLDPIRIQNCKTSFLEHTNSRGCDETTSPKPIPQQHHHIALLFITIDDLPFELIWKRWIEDFYTQQSSLLFDPLQHHVSVLCHAKYPERVQSTWLQDHLLLQPPLIGRNTTAVVPSQPPAYHTHRPEWGSVEITRAMIDLLQEGLRIGTQTEDDHHIPFSTIRYLVTQEQLKDSSQAIVSSSSLLSSSIQHGSSSLPPPVNRFIFLSESCLPVTSLSQVYHSLFDHDKKINNTVGQSWIHARNTPNNGFSRQNQWDAMSTVIPKECIWKADQWMILTRFHAWYLCSTEEEKEEASMSTMNQQCEEEEEKERNTPLDSRMDSLDNKKKIELWKAFRKVRASDEMYFPTIMALLGLLKSSSCHKDNLDTDEIIYPNLGDDIVNRRVTYCDWSNNAKNPETFPVKEIDHSGILKRTISEAHKEGCLFARKFKLEDQVEKSSLSQTDKGSSSIADVWMGLIKRENLMSG